MKKRFKNLFNLRVVSLLLAIVTLSTTLPVEALANPSPAVYSAQQRAAQGAGSSTSLQEITISNSSTIQELANGNTIVIGEDGTAVLENGMAPNANGAPSQPNMVENPLIYDEAANEFVKNNDKLTYKGSVPGTGLATYEVAMDADATEMDGIMTQAEINELRAYYEADIPNAGEMADMMGIADDFSASVKRKATQDSGFNDNLAENERTSLFSVIRIDQASGKTLGDIAAAANVDYQDSGYQDSGYMGAPETEIYVVDDTTLLFVIKDAANVGINGVAVTVVINGQKKEAVTRTSNGVAGIAIIEGVGGLHSGFVSLEKAGYRIITEEDVDIAGGAPRKYTMIKTSADDFYVRAMSIGGADMMNKGASLWLTPGKIDKAFSIAVTLANGESANKLENMELTLTLKRRDGSTKELAKIKPTRKVGNYSQQYEISGKWAELGNNQQFQDGDTLVISDSAGHILVQPRLQVKNSPLQDETPLYQDIDYSLFGKFGFALPDDLPVVGGTTFSADILDVAFTIVVNPSGKGIFCYNTKLDEVIKKEEFYDEPFNPRKEEKTEKTEKGSQSKFDKQVELFKNGRSHLPEGQSTRFFSGSSSAEINGAVSGLIECDFNSGDFKINTGAMIGIEGNFSMTYYLVYPPVPPVYAGFNVAAGASAAGGVGVKFNRHDFMNTLAIRFGGDDGYSITPHIALSLYAGMGIHGLVCIEGRGTGDLEYVMSISPHDPPPAGKSLIRRRLNAQFDLTIEAIMLVFKAAKTWKTDKYNLVDNWEQGGKMAATQMEEETSLYQVTFPGSEAEVASPQSNSLTGPLASAISDTVATQTEAEYANGEDASDGYTTAVADTVSSSMPIKYITANGTNYVFRIAYMKYKNLGYTYPTVVFQKENPDGNSFENKLYMVPNYDNNFCYDYDFDVMVLDHQEQRYRDYEVMLSIQTGQQKTFGNTMDYITKNSIIRAVHLNLRDNKLVTQKSLSQAGSNGKVARYLPKVGFGATYNNVGFTWLESPNIESAGTKTDAKFFYSGYNIPYERFEATSTRNYEGGVVIETAVGASSAKDENNNIFSPGALSAVRYGAPNKEGTYYQLRSTNKPNLVLATEKTGISNLQFVFDWNPGASNFSKDGTLYNAGGQPKLITRDTWLGKPLEFVNIDNKPFILPEGCTTFKYVTGKINGQPAAKLVTVNKLATGEGANKKVDSILSVYNLDFSKVEYVDGGKIVVHGPKKYTFKNQDINRLDAMIYSGSNSPGLRALYTVNTVSKVIKESETDMATGTIQPGIVEEACALYRWNEPFMIEAKATSLFVDNPNINKSGKFVKAELTVENTGTERLDAITYQITDNNGAVVKSETKNVVSYPGESARIDASFAIPATWQVGGMKLSAKVLSCKYSDANGTETVPTTGNETADWEIEKFADCSLDMEVTEQILDSGHYALASFQNESIAPSADDTYLRIYSIRDNDIATSDEKFQFKLGSLAIAGDNTPSKDWKNLRYNMLLPLDEYWNDENCSAVVIELSSEISGDPDATNAVRTVLENPKAPHRFMLSTMANNPEYGKVEGGGYSLLGTTRTLNAIPNAGYRFVEWKDETGSTVSTDSTYSYTIDDSPTMLMKAVFAEDGTQHRVTLKPNTHMELVGTHQSEVDNGVAVAKNLIPVEDYQDMSYVVNHGESITVVAEPRFGYEFVAWQDEDGKVLSNKSSYTFNAMREIELSAIFKSTSDTFVVYFDATTNGGTTTVASMETDGNGKLSALPTAQKSGAAFRGWFTEALGGTRVTEAKVYTGNTVLYAQFSGGSSSGGGSSSQSDKPINYDYASPEVKDGKVDATALAKSMEDALKAGSKYVLVRNANEISPEAMKAAYNAANKLSIYADTTVNGITMLRLYLNPALGKDLKNSILVGGTVSETTVTTLFEKYYDNKLTVLHLNQNGTFGMPVGIAARMDISALDTKTLYFYSYNRETNKYYRINTKYFIDTNGYLRFTTTLAGDIVITDTPLVLKKK